MGVNKKAKYKGSRRGFGQAGGRNSRLYHRREKARLLKSSERILWYNLNPTCSPAYQLIRKQSSRTLKTKIIVKRVPFMKDPNGRLMKLGSKSLKFKYVPHSKPVTGYRIMNLDLLQEHIVSLTSHACFCSKAQDLVKSGQEPIKLKTEMNQNGLFSILVVVCVGCNTSFQLKNSLKQPTGQYDINVRAVWGSVTSGGGATKLNEQLATMNIPQMRAGLFSNLEDQLGVWWHAALKEEMAKAGAEEKRIAIQKGNFHEGVPAITVVCDGGWSKRTHKHTYNAAGGVAVIFGAATGKLLYIGVRNKQCLTCKRASNKNLTPPVHNCFCNWTESSQSMESDIILNGFMEAESTHGLRYTKIIADGDSSVFSSLQEKVPHWGRSISKLECANHTCKCVRSNLEKLVQEKPQYKGKGKLTKYNRVRLTTAIRCAIRMRSKDHNSKLLRQDILNSIYHILGFHERCSEFCTKKKIQLPDQDDLNFDSGDSFDEIFEEQVELWKFPTQSEENSSRLACKNVHKLSELKELIADVQIILNRVANKSDRLVGNFTTNLAESWMAIRAKFDGGKVINRCGGGSWATRCYGGALRKNLGLAWSPLTFQHTTQTQAGTHFFQGVRKQCQKLAASHKYHQKPESKSLRNKRKLDQLKQTNSKKAKRDYGSNLDDSPDITQNEIGKLSSAFYKKHVVKTTQEINLIENNTVQQQECNLWKKERRLRLTSSNFGKIVHRRNNNVSTVLVKNILYSQFKGNRYTIRGLAQESNTVIEYKNQKADVTVTKTGLKICEQFPFLAASTDGLIQDKDKSGLLEIKNFLQTNTYLIKEAAEKIPSFCLQLKSNKLSLKRKHEIYYQIQGQLNIFNRDWCDFIVRRTDPYDIFVERIYKDQQIWKDIMLPKLTCFYFKFILPELAIPRFGTYTGIRKPVSPWFDPNVDYSLEVASQGLTDGTSQTFHTTSAVQSHSTTPSVLNVTASASNPNLATHPKELKTANVSVRRKSTRAKKVKFVGRKILHKWVLDETSGTTKWYKGTVLQVLKGKDGEVAAVYEVLYEGEDSAHEVEDLHVDLQEGSLEFIDV